MKEEIGVQLAQLSTRKLLEKALGDLLDIHEFDIDQKNAKRLALPGANTKEILEAAVKRAELECITREILVDRTSDIEQLVMGQDGDTMFYGFNIAFSSVISRIPFGDSKRQEELVNKIRSRSRPAYYDEDHTPDAM